ncbi:hypothetical protein KP509_07G074500 [Ceratopteris richardii]|uniref:Uncharacterized protein n=1 Tax=Ceratopteris richardii TaxID=49495 RepID=A0A8T2UI56_CERRI|nr:hypothetical protein KP509_07G074500 [Ceratopteris richardii]
MDGRGRKPKRKNGDIDWLPVDNGFVGQKVHGVLDGSFDAGYLLTVRVGNTQTVLRGAVFEPALSVPVSDANDIAPHLKFINRTEKITPSLPYFEQHAADTAAVSPVVAPVVSGSVEWVATGNHHAEDSFSPLKFINRNEQTAPSLSSPEKHAASSSLLSSVAPPIVHANVERLPAGTACAENALLPVKVEKPLEPTTMELGMIPCIEATRHENDAPFSVQSYASENKMDHPEQNLPSQSSSQCHVP